MSEKLNLQDIAALLAEKSGITKKEAELFLKEWIDTLQEALWNGQSVKIKNLGNFKLLAVNDRESVDIVSGNRVLIPAHYKINFIPDSELAQRVNEPFRLFDTVELDEEVPSDEASYEEAPVEKAPSEESSAGAIPLVVIEPEPIRPVTPFNPNPLKLKPLEKKKKKTWIDRIATILCIAVLLIAGSVLVYFRFLEQSSLKNSPAPQNVTNLPHSNDELSLPASDSLMLDSQLPEETKPRTVQPGERLTLIALDEYGDKIFWVYLYEENKAILKNPDYIQAGLTIRIPPASKYGIDRSNAASLQKAKELQKQIQQN